MDETRVDPAYPSAMNKAEIVAEIRERVHEWHAKNIPDLDIRQACFYWAVLSHGHLKAMNQFGKVLISAGTMSYPRINLANDDGKINTHFSYMWEPDSPATKLAIRENRMPEMHVWVQMPDRREIFDITTCYLKEQCINTSHQQWLGPDPPDFIWCKPEELPVGVRYEPSASAVQLVVHFIRATWG